MRTKKGIVMLDVGKGYIEVVELPDIVSQEMFQSKYEEVIEIFREAGTDWTYRRAVWNAVHQLGGKNIVGVRKFIITDP